MNHRVRDGQQVTGSKYRVVFERDETRAWIATVPSVRGCHTHGRTLAQARKRIREALGLWLDDADEAALVEEIRLPSRALRAVQESREARHEAALEREKANALTVRAARTLVREHKLGLRDAADLLGLSHQRVQQLVRGQSGAGNLGTTAEYAESDAPLANITSPR